MTETDPERLPQSLLEDAPERCSFWLTRKACRCRHPVRPGTGFCGNHQPRGDDGARVRCPVDPTHTVKADELERHVQVCPRASQQRVLQAAPHFREGVNRFSADATPDTADSGAPVAVWEASELERVAELVLRAAAAEGVLAELPPAPRCPPRVRAALNAAAAAGEQPVSEKHGAQRAAILGHLAERGLLPPAPGAVVAELGAGRGYLLHLLADAYLGHEGGAAGSGAEGPARGGDAQPVRLLLVDREPRRYKAERTLREVAGVEVERLRCDVADLDLPAAAPGQDPVLVIAKHLCGSGTDMALRAAARCGARLAGCALATCCHHRCTWDTYTAPRFLQRHGIGPRELRVLTHMCGWGTAPACAGDAVTSDCCHTSATAAAVGEGAAALWGTVERRAIGTAAKSLLDAGRLQWLRESAGFGGDAALVAYVERATSPENRLLLAWRPAANDGERRLPVLRDSTS